ncbi:MAG: DNA-3-methyladenine glycosylase I, partial [Thermomonas sp.]
TYNEADVARLLIDAGIVRHRGKIEAVIHNASRAIELQGEFGSLAKYFWNFEVDIHGRPKKLTTEVLRTFTTAPESIALSKDLKKRGWKFVGPTTMYAFMQAMGLVNDHQHDCFVREVATAARDELAITRPVKSSKS